MNKIVASLLTGTAFAVHLSGAFAADSNFTEGPFKPTAESLQQYQCPEWFRDAKLGIWAVWGPESVPMQGDWYARNLYIEGWDQNKFQIQHYGHPSKVGFKDVIPLWKAEKWNPEQLMALYKKAGAKYFCMIAMHHDNFDCWNSKNHRWNSVAMGPKRDVAGEWQRAARKEGLRFGMTEHLAASWWFYSAAKGADKKGALAGVPYDGNDPQYADLYWANNKAPAFHYYGVNAPESVQKAWYDRIREMVDTYQPDLLYSDSPLPYPEKYGRALVAHYYNQNIKAHGGKLEAVYNCKQDPAPGWVLDIERGQAKDIRRDPWQTDTCIGGWYYRLGESYKSVETIIPMFIDIVSKNGNLLLNFPPKPDGTLDAKELHILECLADWTGVNGEAIYGTRPFRIFGEGPNRGQGGNFGEGKTKYEARDIRFTTKGNTLYALCLGIPKGEVTITTLAKGTPQLEGEIKEITLLGSDAKLDWKCTEKGLVITMPENAPCAYAVAFRIAGLKRIAWDGSVATGTNSVAK